MKKQHLILSAGIIFSSGLLIWHFMPQENSTQPLSSVKTSTAKAINVSSLPVEDASQLIVEETLPATDSKLAATITTEKEPPTETVKENTQQLIIGEETRPLPLAEEEQLSTISDLWEPLEQDTVFANFPPEQDLESVQAIRLNAVDMIGTLKEGDIVNLPLIEGEEYTATITATENFENGASSMTGNYEVNGETYTITLTQGIKTSFGTFTTPHGTYQISLLAGKGYLYSSDDLDEKRIDTKITDVLIPEEDS